MARIYNQMPFTITVNAGLVIIPEGSITIDSGQRSDSINWDSANNITVSGGDQGCVCKFDFGVHAQIQGGNYAMIQPGSFLVYDSNHDVISTGSAC